MHIMHSCGRIDPVHTIYRLTRKNRPHAPQVSKYVFPRTRLRVQNKHRRERKVTTANIGLDAKGCSTVSVYTVCRFDTLQTRLSFHFMRL